MDLESLKIDPSPLPSHTGSLPDRNFPQPSHLLSANAVQYLFFPLSVKIKRETSSLLCVKDNKRNLLTKDPGAQPSGTLSSYILWLFNGNQAYGGGVGTDVWEGGGGSQGLSKVLSGLIDSTAKQTVSMNRSRSAGQTVPDPPPPRPARAALPVRRVVCGVFHAALLLKIESTL